MAKKRKDGRYQRKILLASGKYKIVYGKTLAELNKNVQNIRDQESQGLVVDDNTLVGEWAKQWLETYKSSLRAATVRMYRNAYNNHILQHIGNMPLRAVRAVHVQAVMNDVSDKSESLQHKVLLTINQIFESARQNHLILRNPADGIKITKHATPEKQKYLTAEQQEELMSSLADLRARAFCGLCLYCGLRREEALGVQWGDIKGNQLTVNRSVTFVNNQPDPNQELKTKAAHRVIPIPDPLIDILAHTPHLGIYVVTNADGGPITEIGFKRLWEKVKKSVPFYLHPHMLRHSYATSLYKANVDLKTAQYLLGHSDIKMTATIYTHAERQDATASLAKINSLFSKSSQKVVKTQ